MTDHRSTAKRRLVHYFQVIVEGAGIRLDGDCLTEIEGIVDDIIAAAREPTTSADPLCGYYKFTYEQLYDLLAETVDMFCEYIEKHGHVKESARSAAVLEALERLDVERELWEQGEVTKLSQVLP